MRSMSRRFARVALVGLAIVAVSACGVTRNPTQAPRVDARQLRITVPVPGRDKTVIEQGTNVLQARLEALKIGTFSFGIGDVATFEMTLDDPSLEPAVRAALAAFGRVTFLPTPAATLPLAGAPVPVGVEPLFDAATQIASASVTTDGSGGREVDIVLGPDGTKALADYTSTHIGQGLIVALDGKVVAAPVVMEAIRNGQLALTFGQDSPVNPAALAAIMTSGPLPDEWLPH